MDDNGTPYFVNHQNGHHEDKVTTMPSYETSVFYQTKSMNQKVDLLKLINEPI